MIFTNASLVKVNGNVPYGLQPNGAIWFEDDHIKWVGSTHDLPVEAKSVEQHDLEDRLVTPGLIDCHTHIVFGGNRANEFEMRLNGASYEDVARAGGGIVSTVKATRAASREDLLAAALKRVDALIAEGTTTLEIKSGYGLDIETELKMLQVAKEIARVRPINILTSFLGAHTIPPEYSGRADAYIQDVCLPALEAANTQGLVDAVDGFCENIAFSRNQIRKVFNKAKSLNLPVKLHAEQLSNLGGAKLAAEFGALSADHLEYANEADVAAMAKAGTVTVVLPGAYYTLRETQPPPIDTLRKHGVAMALATDCNPGSSPVTSLLLTMNMACTLFRMTPQEALVGITRNAATALGLRDRGTIEIGKRADLAIWDVEQPAELSYRVGFNPLHMRVCGGKIT